MEEHYDHAPRAKPDGGAELTTTATIPSLERALEQEREARMRAEAERDDLAARELAARRKAEAANRMKDEFLAVVSHELRTPLNAMLGWIQLLRSGSVPEARRSRALETIERAAKAQAQLVDDLLDVSRILSGKLRIEAGLSTQRATPTSVSPTRLEGLRVLLVEDEADARDLLVMMLEQYGAKVTAVSSAAEALRPELV